MMTDTTQTLAQLLATARTQHGLSRAQLAAVSRVPLAFIVAIEEEDHRELPAAVFCRGFLRLIAKHLQLDHRHLLAAYAVLQPPAAPDALLTASSDVLSSAGQRKTHTRRYPKSLLLAALALVLFSVWYFLPRHLSDSPVPSADSETPTAAVLATPTASIPAPVQQRLRLQVIRPLQIEVALDAAPPDPRLLLPQSYEFTFTQQARLLISDTSAVKLWFNGEGLGDLTRHGRQRLLIFKTAPPPAQAKANADHHFQR